MAIIQMKKTAEGQPKQAIMAALGTEFYVKTIVVVDEDVDIFNLADVMWAVSTRAKADKDVTLIHGAMGAILDPTSDPEDHTLTKVGIDATKPTGRRPLVMYPKSPEYSNVYSYTYKAPYQVGDAFTHEDAPMKVEVLAKEGDNYRVRITRRKPGS